MAALRDHLAHVADGGDPMRPTAETGFRTATFTAVIKSAAHLSTGNMRAVIEVPYAESDAFLETRKAFDIELAFTVTRKVPQTD